MSGIFTILWVQNRMLDNEDLQECGRPPRSMRFMWRFRTGLPFPGVFGHTTIELAEIGSEGKRRASYGFVGWSDSPLKNVALFFKIVFGFSVPGKWSRNAGNIFSLPGKWHAISEKEAHAMKRHLDMLLPLCGTYNLYTRNSWQIPRRIIAKFHSTDVLNMEQQRLPPH